MASRRKTSYQIKINGIKKAFAILVVDDELHMRNSLKELLAIYGMNCTLAEDGHQALELLNNNDFDLVLLDIKMPKKNGLQVMNEISDHYSDTDFIVISGETSFENSREAFGMGANDFLSKPYNPSELIDLIHKIIEKRHLKSKKKNVFLENSFQNSIDNTLKSLEDIIHNEDLTFAHEIINSSPAVAFLWKNVTNWPVQFVSENVVNLLGYTANELMTGSIVYTNLIHQGDLSRVIKEIVTDNTTQTFKHKPYRMITKSGTTRWVEDSSSIVRDEQGNISHYQGIIIDVTERELVKQEMLKNQMSLQYTAHHDALTELPNRLLLMDRIQQSIKKSRRANKHFAILYIDLDKFKPVNDTYGHAAGDEVLKVVAKRLTANVRAVDTIARIGGDEFIVLMESVNHIHDVESLAHKLNQSLSQSINWKSHKLVITSSIGISLFPDDGDTAEELIKNSDSAMYQSKVKEGNVFQFYQHT